MSAYPTDGIPCEDTRNGRLLDSALCQNSGGNLSNRIEGPIQFGRAFGLFLITLGIISLIMQAALFLSSRRSNPTRSSVKVEHRSNANPLPGIVGTASIVGGIGFYSMARRGEESESNSRN